MYFSVQVTHLLRSFLTTEGNPLPSVLLYLFSLHFLGFSPLVKNEAGLSFIRSAGISRLPRHYDCKQLLIHLLIV
jgi:hypothetical protein